MIVEDINKKLEEIYSSLMEKYEKIPPETKENINEEGEKEEIIGRDFLTFPYLLQVNNNFIESEKRIVIFGQESFGWGDKEFRFWGDFIDFSCLPEAARKKLKLFPSIIGGNDEFDCIKNLMMSLMALYNWKNLEDFVCDGSIYKNFYRFLKEYCAECGYSIIRNNLAKIGYKYGMEGNNTQINIQFLEFVIQELELLNPDILIFLAGTMKGNKKLITRLLSHFNNKYEEEYFSKNEISEKHPVRELDSIFINKKQVRIIWSYHPTGASYKGLLQIMKDNYTQLIK